MAGKIIFITKDALCLSYCPVYGNTFWSTPNIDELARKGTVFFRHYTAAPSTYMACVSMFTGRYPYETEQQYYLPNNEDYGITIWERASKLGFSCHTIWPDPWVQWISNHINLYPNVKFHTIPNFKQSVGTDFPHQGFLMRDENKCLAVKEAYREMLESVAAADEHPFVWVHFPHVINGRVGYGDDIDVFDACIGITRDYFDDDEIFISADHGNMNGLKNKVCYGFDVYEPAIRIPFITPRIESLEAVNYPTSNVDLFSIIFEKTIPKREIVVADNMYYCQPFRKIALIHGDYKLIYNKASKVTELYDLSYDPGENCNLFEDTVYDEDRKASVPLRELYFYPRWDQLEEERMILSSMLKTIWREPTIMKRLHGFAEDRAKAAYKKVRKIIRKQRAKKA